MTQQRFRDILLVLLAVTTGATDAAAFERLGHVFASVITGNLVLLGISAVRGDGRLALFGGCALAGYAAGVLAAAPRSPDQGADRPPWPAGVTGALTAQSVLLVMFGAGWVLAGAHPSETTEILLLVAAAAAMGIQSTAVRRMGSLSTTYLTSTLTGLIEALAVRQWDGSHARSLAILLAAVAGAAAATGLILHARPWLPALQLVPLAIVISASLRLIRR